MTERLDLFSTPILKATLPDHESLNAALIDAIRAKRAKDGGIDRSNIGGWHSDIDMAPGAGEPAQGLAQFAIEQVSQHMIDVAKGGKRKFTWGVDMWANINGPGN
ncbi:MAG: hypothetical protein R3358_10470, partial [Woeseiaceae bacterium]|nr:hypothetical protein [Woeseiaceae bacterium]